MSCGRGLDVVDAALVVVVGGPDQGPAQPRKGEDRPPLPRGHDRAGVQRQVLVAQDDVAAPAGGDLRQLGLGVQLVGANPVRPHARGVDHVLGADGERTARLLVVHRDLGPGPIRGAELGDAQPVGADRAEALRLSQHREHEPGVIGLAVIEQVAAAGPPVGDRRQQPRDLVAVDEPVTRRAPVRLAVGRGGPPRAAPPAQRRRGHDVVHVQADPGQAVRPAGAVERRQHEGQRPDQVRRQPDHELALEQRLAHQPQVEVLQVAQTAVDQLGRAAARPRGEVGLLHQGHAVPAGGRVQSHPGAGDPAADDEHVIRVLGQGRQGVVAGAHGRPEPTCGSHTVGFTTVRSEGSAGRGFHVAR